LFYISVAPDILEIYAAVDNEGNSSFHEFVFPTKEIQPQAHELNGFSVTSDNKLLRYGEIVDAKPKEQALRHFVKWLQNLKTPVVLVDHYVTFARHVLCENISHYPRMSKKFGNVVKGFGDTVAIFRRLYPRQSCTRAALVERILGNNFKYKRYNAVHHVKALRNIVRERGITKSDILNGLMVNIFKL